MCLNFVIEHFSSFSFEKYLPTITKISSRPEAQHGFSNCLQYSTRLGCSVQEPETYN